MNKRPKALSVLFAVKSAGLFDDWVAESKGGAGAPPQQFDADDDVFFYGPRQAQPAPPAQPVQQPPFGELATQIGVPVAAGLAINAAAKKLTGRVPGMLPAVSGVDLGMDILDAAGIHNSDGTKSHRVWQAPRYDGKGAPVLNPDGSHAWDYGLNRKALGWNMDEFNRATTPDDTIAFGMSTGNKYVDRPLSYVTAGLQAHSNPGKGALSIGKFQYYDANPLVQLATNPEERAGWYNLARGKALPGGGNTSIQLTAANHYAGSQPWRPGTSFRQGGANFDREADIHRKNDTYHAVYNPSGSKGRPGWLGRMWDGLWN